MTIGILISVWFTFLLATILVAFVAVKIGSDLFGFLSIPCIIMTLAFSVSLLTKEFDKDGYPLPSEPTKTYCEQAVEKDGK